MYEHSFVNVALNAILYGDGIDTVHLQLIKQDNLTGWETMRVCSYTIYISHIKMNENRIILFAVFFYGLQLSNFD